MPIPSRFSPASLFCAGLMALLGLALLGGGIWLAAKGGSWYYAIVGVALLGTAILLARRSTAALWSYALLTAGTLAWALWEVGLDWWPLVVRGDIIFPLGAALLTPWVTRGLSRTDGATRPDIWRGGGLALAAVLVMSAVAGGAALLMDQHRIDGQLPAATGVVTADAGGVPDGEWHSYGRTGFGQRYSPLDQITPGNVGRLQVAWTYHTGDVRSRPGDPLETTFEVTPLKIGARLFLCTPHQNVIALDADTGREIWRYEPKVQGHLALQHLTCRGLSYHDGRAAVPGRLPAEVRAPDMAPAGQPAAATDSRSVTACARKIFMPTSDGRLIALDPESGGVCLDFGTAGQVNLWANMPNVRPGAYYATSPAVVTRSLVIIGGSVLDNVSTSGPSGVIRAFDVNTGALVWAWDSARPSSSAPLSTVQTYIANSPNSWSISSVDETMGMIYVPLGNQPPDQWGGNRTAEVERFSSSVVALDLANGQVRWVFQTVHHDLWDYDVPSQPSLIDLTVGGQRIPALVQPTKQGEVYVLDRRDGTPILPVTETQAPQGAASGDHTAPTQPVSRLSYDPPPLTGADMWGATLLDQLTCRIALRGLRYDGRYTPPSLQGSLIYPGNLGVFNWGGIAVDPRRQVAFTTPTYLAFVSRLVPRNDATSMLVQGGSGPQGSLPALNENFGAPYAVHLSAFTSIIGLPCQRPPWGYVAGADLTTGRIVWQHKNGTTRDSWPAPIALPMGVPNLGGPIMTAGGVAFLSGTLDYYVRAYDVSNGQQLWQARLPAGGQATPMTYLGGDGRQYILVAAGGHGSFGTRAGDSVIAYALPPGDGQSPRR